jgi:hypothetical protein
MELGQPSWFKLEFFISPSSQGLLLGQEEGVLDTKTLPTPPPPKPSSGANNFLSNNHHQGGLAHALSKGGLLFFHYSGV